MVIVIKNNSNVPIYDQIKNQILDAIMSGEIKEGECLPSIRGLARDLKVSVITTTKAYNDLETAGYIFAVQGKGYYVSERSNEILYEKLLEEIESHFDQAILISKKAALKETDLIAILQNLLKQEER
ncbi:MAG: GntR family transcriptional regulator [Lachnospiraceae bacterium]|nr:GntR family transcriptional regulator [Lachnospiraceae bacterium]MBD5496680.1 GntR family transcriptional regulator [Lachnospiraceae bacterium]MBD5511929.1 GntR family transcriptional regulator [Lachnospiraceae bacterium]MBD5536598.1 GntR family transcriptional regulator [Lachnospiraceae bacterium]MDE5803139.1 GntR family transcriptional regulator [Lachnospiraceae bacterium]